MLKLSSLIAFILFLAAFAVFAADPCIDINIASPEELERIKHIGESRAKQIIALRQEKPFSSVDELDRVVGIGPVRLADIKQEGLACVQQQEQDYPNGIKINEIMPSPEGADETNEWIEIFNQNDFEADLTGWQITDAVGKVNVYIFPNGTKIPAKGFLTFNRAETKIILNNEGDIVNLIKPNGQTADSLSYEKAELSQSYGPGANKTTPLTIKPAAKEASANAGLAAISEVINLEPSRRDFYPLFIVFGLAILSGFVILLLKYVRT